jgi:hypothetical protein
MVARAGILRHLRGRKFQGALRRSDAKQAAGRGISQYPENACAESTLECGSSSYRLCARGSKAVRQLTDRASWRFAHSQGLWVSIKPTSMSNWLENTHSSSVKIIEKHHSPRVRERQEQMEEHVKRAGKVDPLLNRTISVQSGKCPRKQLKTNE